MFLDHWVGVITGVLYWYTDVFSISRVDQYEDMINLIASTTQKLYIQLNVTISTTQVIQQYLNYLRVCMINECKCCTSSFQSPALKCVILTLKMKVRDKWAAKKRKKSISLLRRIICSVEKWLKKKLKMIQTISPNLNSTWYKIKVN